MIYEPCMHGLVGVMVNAQGNGVVLAVQNPNDDLGFGSARCTLDKEQIARLIQRFGFEASKIQENDDG